MGVAKVGVVLPTAAKWEPAGRAMRAAMSASNSSTKDGPSHSATDTPSAVSPMGAAAVIAAMSEMGSPARARTVLTAWIALIPAMVSSY